jgi:hypothetical protein
MEKAISQRWRFAFRNREANTPKALSILPSLHRRDRVSTQRLD